MHDCNAGTCDTTIVGFMTRRLPTFNLLLFVPFLHRSLKQRKRDMPVASLPAHDDAVVLVNDVPLIPVVNHLEAV